MRRCAGSSVPVQTCWPGRVLQWWHPTQEADGWAVAIADCKYPNPALTLALVRVVKSNIMLQADYQSKPISAVAWAPTLGRPVELVAVAAGQRVIIWSMQGAADSMQVGGCSQLLDPNLVSSTPVPSNSAFAWGLWGRGYGLTADGAECGSVTACLPVKSSQ